MNGLATRRRRRCPDLLHTLGGAVDVGVGAELFDDVDRDLQAEPVGRGDLDVLGADTDDDPAAAGPASVSRGMATVGCRT
jgi:hypothetical protein